MADFDVPDHELSPIDLGIMQVVWTKKRVTVREIHEILKARKEAEGERPHKPSTIATYVDRLKNRGFLDRQPGAGREYEYFPIVPKAAIEERMMRKLSELCDDEGEFLHRFAGMATLNARQRKELQRLANRLRRESK